MTNTELLQEGINLMFVGMGFVMIFLLILIYAINLISLLIVRYFPEPVIIKSISQPVPPTSLAVPSDTEYLHSTIVAVVTHHRRQQGLK